MIVHVEFQMRKAFPHLFEEHRGVVLTYLFKLAKVRSVEMFADGGIRVAFDLGSDRSVIDSALIQKEIDILIGVEIGLCPCSCGAALALSNCFVQSGAHLLPLEDLSKEEVDFLANNQFIHAIKAHRQRTGAGLKDSKDRMDAYRAKHAARLQQLRDRPQVL